jgi:ComEC/Rec2-related protein
MNQLLSPISLILISTLAAYYSPNSTWLWLLVAMAVFIKFKKQALVIALGCILGCGTFTIQQAALTKTELDAATFLANIKILKIKKKPNFQQEVVITANAVYGLVKVDLTTQEKLEVGQHWLAEFVLETPKNFTADFDYAAYLKSRNIHTVAKKFSLIKLVEDSSALSEKLANFKNKLCQQISEYGYTDTAALICGLWFGEADFSSEFKDQLKLNGLMHIVSVSGFNVSLVATVIKMLLNKLSKYRQLMLTAIILVLYGWMIGSDNYPAWRAIWMWLLLMFAQFAGRKLGLELAFLYATCLMWLTNQQLIFNLSWQLSSLAYWGIILLLPKLNRGLIKFRIKNQDLATSIATTLATFPVTWFTFGQVVATAAFANMLILPTVSYLMAIGGLVFIAHLLQLNITHLLLATCDYYVQIGQQILQATSRWVIIITPQNIRVITPLLGIGVISLGCYLLKRNRSRYA